jgi:hypothetical protein
MIQEGPLFHKPKSFLTAKKLLYASIFLGILNAIIACAMLGFVNYGGIESLLINAVTLLLIFFLIHQMSLCKKWARTTFLILFIAGFACFPFVFIQLFKVNLFIAALTLLLTAIQILAVFFLYTKESNIWFNNSTSEVLP